MAGAVRRITLQFETKDGIKLPPVSFDVEDGQPGPVGSKGDSAYEVWLKQPGNAGKSEAQYIEALKASVEIVQTLGSSTGSVPSQKLVTDQFNLRVPMGRKINGKALTSDITLLPGDVNAYSKAEIDQKIAAINQSIAGGGETTTSINQDLQSYKVHVNENFVPKTRKVNGKGLNVDITLSATDVGAYSKAESDTALAKKLDDTQLVQGTGTSTTDIMSQKATTDQLNGKVPTSRKVNGKALTGDITLVPGDIGAYTKAEIDQLVQDTGGAAVGKGDILQTTGTGTDKLMSQKATTDQLATKVPTSRKVNGKALTGDVSLSASDVGAYSKTEVDTKLGNIGKRWSFTAEGGETTVTPGFSFKNCAVTIDGFGQPSPYSFVVENNIITLAGPLMAGEILEMVVIQ